MDARYWGGETTAYSAEVPEGRRRGSGEGCRRRVRAPGSGVGMGEDIRPGTQKGYEASQVIKWRLDTRTVTAVGVTPDVAIAKLNRLIDRDYPRHRRIGIPAVSEAWRR